MPQAQLPPPTYVESVEFEDTYEDEEEYEDEYDEVDAMFDFVDEGGIKPAKKDYVEHDLDDDRVVDSDDLGRITPDYGSAKTVGVEDKAVVDHGDIGGQRRAKKDALSKGKDVLVQLEKLGELKEKGILTEEEFQRKKKELLG
jgi:hypothetical protein